MIGAGYIGTRSRRPIASGGSTPGVATVTLTTSGAWSPGSVPGANPLLPLVIRVYGAGGNGGLPEEATGGGGGGGGAFRQSERASWSTGDGFDAVIPVGGAGTDTQFYPHSQPGNMLWAQSGQNAAGIVPGQGGSDGDAEGTGWSNTGLLRTGGNGSAGSGSIAGGGGASGSTGGNGGAGDSDTPGDAAAADGGDGGYGGDGDVGGTGNTPGGGAGGTSEPGTESASGGDGRVVILVPTLT